MTATLEIYTPSTLDTTPGQTGWRRDMLGFMAAYRNPRTFEAYKRDLAVFVEWLERFGLNPYELERPHLQTYLRHLETDLGYAEATVSRRFGTVATWFAYLVDEDRIAKDPCRKVARPKVDREKQRRTWLTAMETNKLVEAAMAESPSTLVLIAFMLLIGMRVSEATGVQVEDISLGGRPSLKVLSKGSKLLTHAIPIELLPHVTAVVDGRTEGPLLLNRAGRPMTPVNARRILARVKAKAGITRDLTPHGCRRAMVTNALAMGVPLTDVQKSLGHSSPTTTSGYDVSKNHLHKHATHAVTAAVFGAIEGY